MIGLFQERNPFLVPLLFLLAIALKWAFISQPLPAEPATSGGLLDEWIYGIWWKKIHPSLLSAISLLILFFSGIFFNNLLTEKRMYQKSHFLTALSFILLTSIFAGVQRMHPGIIMLPITLVLYRQSLQLYNPSNPKTIVTNMGLLVGTGVLLYHPFWWMVPFCILALAIMRPFKLNEWALFIISFLLPAYIILSYEYLTDQWNPGQHWPVWNPIKALPSLNPWWMTAITIVFLWSMNGITASQKSNLRMLIQTRKNWSLMLLLGIFILPSIFFPKGNINEGITLLLLPLSAFCTYSFLPSKKQWYHVAAFWVLVIFAICCSWAVLHKLM